MEEIKQAAVVKVDQLNRRFGKNQALDGVSLEIAAGTVTGLVGENGAGKTTLIKHLLGLLRAQSGSVRVFGMNPVKSPRKVLSRLGYLSEEPDLPEWMSVMEYMVYMQAFFPRWDMDYAQELLANFDVPTQQRIEGLSKGQRARVALTAAQAHRPDLLVLDEPSSGLDPIVRRDILDAVIRSVVDDGRTVLFSSHLLDEVERVSDHIAMLSGGSLVMNGELETVLESHYHVAIDGGSRAQWFENPLVVTCEPSRRATEFVLQCQGTWADIEHSLAAGCILSHRPLNIDEIFVLHSGRHADGRGADSEVA